MIQWQPLDRHRESSRACPLPVRVARGRGRRAGSTPHPPANFTRVEDVIYGRKDGIALTMDVFTPTAKPNGRGSSSAFR